MTTAEFYSDIQAIGVKLWLDGTQLRYSAPPGAITPALLGQLAERKSDIVAFLSENLSAGSFSGSIQRVSRGKNIPLSFAQQRLWIFDQMDLQRTAYNIPVAYRLKGVLNRLALEESFNEIIRRHEALRTTFAVIDGQPVQKISPKLTLNLPLVDMSIYSDAEREAKSLEMANEEARQPFDLVAGPLLRARLLRLKTDEHILLLTIHHIVSDGWSMGVLNRELSVLYQLFSNGQTSTLPELPIQYADYSIWQRQWLQGEVLEDQLAYWKQRLSNLPPFELATDRPRPAVQTFRGTIQTIALPAAIAERLRELSQDHNATLFMTALAAFKVLLFRYTREEDVYVGTPIANRNREETEGMIGFLGNTLILRTDLSGDPTFTDLIGRVRETALGAYMHQDLPFEKLVEELQPRRNMSRTPLFQIMFVFENANVPSLELPGLALTQMQVETGTAKFDLTFYVIQQRHNLLVSIEYNTDLFDAATIMRMLGHYRVLLGSIVSNPTQKISRLSVLSEKELRQLLPTNSHKRVEETQYACLQQLFEAQVERSPNAIALKFNSDVLTYRQLNCRANQLAHYLRALGVGPETRVGICMEPSAEMVVALLGILKAGGAYLPLDPSYPTERLAFMLEDAQVRVLLTQEQMIERMPKQSARVICLDRDWKEVSRCSEDNPAGQVSGHNLAYVIYTSGSTGKPKGALVSHFNAARLFQTTNAWFNFDEHDVWTLFHSCAFDFSVWELWGALLYGGRLVIVPYAVSRSPEAFYELLTKEEVTVLNQTPSAFRLLNRAEETLRTSGELRLRLVIFGGEALDLRSLKPWFERHGEHRPQLVNMYGITETTVHVSYRPLKLEDVSGFSNSLIGCPLPDLQVYVLDSHMQLVPVGVPGEMYVGGAGVSRGYLHRPDLTAERFVPDPFTQHGTRLYRTGDLARRLPNGDLEYLGRIDQQVKIRGFRIELGEIEALLNQHPAVSEALVIAKEDGSREKRLIAYLVYRNGVPPLMDELRSFLKVKLPDYMVPSAFVVLKTLPLTHHGKVDYRALPEPDKSRPELEKPYAAPRSHIEKVLAKAWSDSLELERVGIHDNFFDLGGDSIRSIQIRAQARQTGIDFSMQDLFRYQTISELAQVATTADKVSLPVAQTQAFSLISDEDRRRMPDDVEDAYPLTMLQAGMIFHSNYSPDSSAYHNVSSLHLRAKFDLHNLNEALRQLTVRHPVLRTSFHLSSFTEPLQLVHRAVEVPLRIDDLRSLSRAEQEERIEAWLNSERQSKFDWTSAPLMRFQIHLRGEYSFQFSWAEHHAILDGWSLASMITELFQIYTSLNDEVAPRISPPSVSTFRDFVALEREALQSEKSRQFWMQYLSDDTTTLMPRWPLSRRSVDTRQSSLDVPITPELSDRLKQFARSAGVPLKSVLLAAHLSVLRLVGGQSHVITGIISNGRLEEIDGERSLGLFLNTLPIKLKMGGGTWLELARETFNAEQEMVPFRRFPLAELQRLHGGRQLFETTFNYVHFYVYQNLSNLKNIEIIDEKEFADTNYPFKAAFSLDLATSRVQLTLGYMSSEFCAEQIQALAGYYTSALMAIAFEPHRKYETHSLLSPAERQKLIAGWNDTKTDYARDLCIHQLFEAQVQRTPDAIAIRFKEQQLTFRQLNDRANQLSHYLRAMGVGPDVLVGLYLPRSVEILVGLLGILKAGGAYVPLDPQYPRERLAFMLEDTRTPVILTEEQLVDTLPAHHAKVIRLDRDWQEIANESVENPRTPVSPRNLAYVIYTSGSTGRPKGVLIEHRSLVNYVQGIERRLGLGSESNYALVQPLTVDACLTAIYPPLVTGGCIHLFSKEDALNAHVLSDYFARHRIDCLKIAPSHLAALHTWPEPQHLMPQRCLVMGGEPLRHNWVSGLQKMAPDCRILNQYGPTEATVGMLTCWFDDGREGDLPATVPTGHPIQNSQVYLLDEYLQPVPVGVSGELFIGGDCLARGYLGRPELTAQSFIPNPFADQPGARLYKSGDIARYLPDGNVEFLGRKDHQVKIRGFRIEIGEIEGVLSQHPAVRETVVMAREDKVGDKELIAYVVSDLEPDVLTNELRGFLKEKLPDYMMPAHFVSLETLPLTPHGKVNVQELPAPGETRPEPDEVLVPPRDLLELELVQIWEDTLNRWPIGVTDNFFDLGGHSISAVRLMAHIQKQFGKELPLSSLFLGATVERLALILRQQITRREPSSLVPIQPAGSKPPFFCVHPVGGNVLCYYELANQLGPDQPFYGLQARGLNHEQEPDTHVEEMAAHYIEALRKVQARGPYFIGGWSMGGVVAFEMARQLQQQGGGVALLALIDSWAPLNEFRSTDMDDAELLAQFLIDLDRLSRRGVAISSEQLIAELRSLDPECQLDYVLKQAQRQDVLAADTDVSQISRLVKIFKANLRAVQRYTPHSLDGRIFLFRAYTEGEQTSTYSSLGWNDLVKKVEVQEISGDHYTILTHPQVQALAEAINVRIAEARSMINCAAQ